MKWENLPENAQGITQLLDKLDISPILAKLLLQRGLAGSANEANSFLHPRLSELEDPFKMSNIGKAADIILRAISKQDDVLVIGDYDVDGITSLAYLIRFLKYFNLETRHLVPRRTGEGYGLSPASLERGLCEKVPSLIIALDCGTNAVDAVKFLRQKNIEVIIIDHHRSKEGVPADCTIVNPHLYDGEDKAWSQLCTVGLVFKLCHGILKKLRLKGDKRAFDFPIKDYLDYVALGTVADLVPLTKENRILTYHGLEILSNSNKESINTIISSCGLSKNEKILPSDISFKIGPRINASGRMADASLSLDLFLSDKTTECKNIMLELEQINKHRQNIEKEVLFEVQAQVEKYQSSDPVIVAFDPNWHTGVVGILAGKLSRLYNKPCIVLGEEDGLAKGSGRSVKGVNLVELLGLCTKDYFKDWGGHPMAIGISLDAKRVDEFRQELNEKASEYMKDIPLQGEVLKISSWVDIEELNLDFYYQTQMLQPFGEANREPTFAIKDLVLRKPVDVFGELNFRFNLPKQGEKISVVAWRMADNIPPCGVPIDIAFKLSKNDWTGKSYLQLSLIDWKEA